MRLNHLDLHVPDVAETTAFFVDYLGFELVALRGAAGLAILRDEGGLELVISHPVEKFGTRHQRDLGAMTYHIGFNLPDRQDVDAAYARLLASPARIGHPPRALRGGWLFYCVAPGDIMVEIGWRPPADPAAAEQLST